MVAFPSGRRTELTLEQYFALEAQAERYGGISHEYYDGEIIARTQINHTHAMITSNAGASLHRKLDYRENCVALSSSMLVRVAEAIYFYPDALAACDAQFTDATEMVLTNPVVVVEVTSDSTALYDRTTKLEAYKRMLSVQEILIVDQHRVHVDQYTRSETAWVVREFDELADTITLDSLGCTLAVSEVYAKVTFEN